MDPINKEGSIFYDLNIQSNYLKYVTKFGAEQNLPGFLMTNQQMIEFIQYQKQCSHNDGTISENKFLKHIFNCNNEERSKDKADD